MPCKINKQKKWKKYQDGGVVDNITALLTEGEYVIKKEAAQKLGYKNLDYMNQTGKIPKFAGGGEVLAMQNKMVEKMPPIFRDQVAEALDVDPGFQDKLMAANKSNYLGDATSEEVIPTYNAGGRVKKIKGYGCK